MDDDVLSLSAAISRSLIYLRHRKRQRRFWIHPVYGNRHAQGFCCSVGILRCQLSNLVNTRYQNSIAQSVLWLDVSFYYHCDSKQKIVTLSMFLLSLAIQHAGGNGAIE